jgi:hypothetical protein
VTSEITARIRGELIASGCAAEPRQLGIANKNNSPALVVTPACYAEKRLLAISRAHGALVSQDSPFVMGTTVTVSAGRVVRLVLPPPPVIERGAG